MHRDQNRIQVVQVVKHRIAVRVSDLVLQVIGLQRVQIVLGMIHVHRLHQLMRLALLAHMFHGRQNGILYRQLRHLFSGLEPLIPNVCILQCLVEFLRVLLLVLLRIGVRKQSGLPILVEELGLVRLIELLLCLIYLFFYFAQIDLVYLVLIAKMTLHPPLAVLESIEPVIPGPTPTVCSILLNKQTLTLLRPICFVFV